MTGKSIVNGHWPIIIKISHITGWLAAAFFCGMQIVGWQHINMDDQRHADMQENIRRLVHIVESHAGMEGHREAVLKMREVERRVTLLEKRN